MNSTPSATRLIWCRVDQAPDTVLAATVEGLSPEDRERAQRFRRDPDRRAFLAGRLLVRTALDGLALCGTLAAAPGRKPWLEGGAGASMPDLSLSHSGGWAALAIGGADAVGVDVEPDDRAVDVLAVAPRVVGRDELARLEAMPPDRRQERFLAGWTVREAWAKALGRGLSADLSLISLDAAGRTIQAPEREDWTLALFRPEPGLLLALALHHPGGPAPELLASRLSWSEGESRLDHVPMSPVAWSRSATTGRRVRPLSASSASTTADEDWT